MELKEFIKNTLVDIRDGVNEANISISEKDGKKLGVNDNANFAIFGRGQGKDDNSIIFDLAVTVSSENKATGKGGLEIAIASLNGEIDIINSQKNISRIKFSISANKSIA